MKTFFNFIPLFYVFIYSRCFMRYFLFLFIFLYLLIFPAFSQQFIGGLKAGVMGTQVDGDTYSGFNKPGVMAGAFVNLRVPFQKDLGIELPETANVSPTESFSPYSLIQMELAFVQKGSRKNPNYEKEDFDEYLLRTDYVELAILYQFVYSRKLAFEVGPGFGYLLHTFERKNGDTDLSPVPFRQTIVNYIGGMYFFFNERTSVNLRMNNSILSLRNHERSDNDRYRFWHYGQFHVALGLILQYQL
ncbi:MAG: outer membrane beta-barrel protein [Bacteroidales bacterium]|nr:hypothetical protein [Bacteroidales bacterium]MDZ4205118.1 outer membrane beta-barrel protein [Bacteroidales bacterium]